MNHINGDANNTGKSNHAVVKQRAGKPQHDDWTQAEPAASSGFQDSMTDITLFAKSGTESHIVDDHLAELWHTLIIHSLGSGAMGRQRPHGREKGGGCDLVAESRANPHRAQEDTIRAFMSFPMRGPRKYAEYERSGTSAAWSDPGEGERGQAGFPATLRHCG